MEGSTRERVGRSLLSLKVRTIYSNPRRCRLGREIGACQRRPHLGGHLTNRGHLTHVETSVGTRFIRKANTILSRISGKTMPFGRPV
jgi:hypothetical protein